MKQTVETAPSKTSLRRRVLIASLMIMGIGLFIVGGLIGIRRVNDPKVVEGEPKIENTLHNDKVQPGMLSVASSENSYANISSHPLEPAKATAAVVAEKATQQDDSINSGGTNNGSNPTQKSTMNDSSKKDASKESKKTQKED